MSIIHFPIPQSSPRRAMNRRNVEDVTGPSSSALWTSLEVEPEKSGAQGSSSAEDITSDCGEDEFEDEESSDTPVAAATSFFDIATESETETDSEAEDLFLPEMPFAPPESDYSDGNSERMEHPGQFRQEQGTHTMVSASGSSRSSSEVRSDEEIVFMHPIFAAAPAATRALPSASPSFAGSATPSNKRHLKDLGNRLVQKYGSTAKPAELLKRPLQAWTPEALLDLSEFKSKLYRLGVFSDPYGAFNFEGLFGEMAEGSDRASLQDVIDGLVEFFTDDGRTFAAGTPP
eukprot:s491_g34.t1